MDNSENRKELEINKLEAKKISDTKAEKTGEFPLLNTSNISPLPCSSKNSSSENISKGIHVSTQTAGNDNEDASVNGINELIKQHLDKIFEDGLEKLIDERLKKFMKKRIDSMEPDRILETSTTENQATIENLRAPGNEILKPNDCESYKQNQQQQQPHLPLKGPNSQMEKMDDDDSKKSIAKFSKYPRVTLVKLDDYAIKIASKAASEAAVLIAAVRKERIEQEDQMESVLNLNPYINIEILDTSSSLSSSSEMEGKNVE